MINDLVAQAMKKIDVTIMDDLYKNLKFNQKNLMTLSY